MKHPVLIKNEKARGIIYFSGMIVVAVVAYLVDKKLIGASEVTLILALSSVVHLMAGLNTNRG